MEGNQIVNTLVTSVTHICYPFSSYRFLSLKSFQLHYTLDRPPSIWSYSTGFVNEEMIRKHMPSPSKDGTTQILMCGPPPMIKFACIPNLEAVGFTEDEWFSF
jgi:NAD(P)H-flavin reductase